jgi:hypothetical protein
LKNTAKKTTKSVVNKNLLFFILSEVIKHVLTNEAAFKRFGRKKSHKCSCQSTNDLNSHQWQHIAQEGLISFVFKWLRNYIFMIPGMVLKAIDLKRGNL